MQSKKLEVLGTVAAITLTALSAHSQPRGSSVAPKAPSLAPITIDPQLRPALAKKKRVNPALLAQTFVVQNGRSAVKLANGKRYELEPAGPEPVPSPSLQMTQLPAQLLPYKAHIDSPWLGHLKNIGSMKLAEGVITHENDQTAIKDQGGRPTCTAFASMAGMEGWAKRNKGKTLDLSENQAFELFMDEADKSCASANGYRTWRSAGVLSDHGVCSESQMPYSSACPASVPAACKANDEYRFKEVKHFFTPKYGGKGSLRADNVNLLESWVRAGYDVVYGVEVAGSDWGDGTLSSGVVDVQLDANGDPVGSGGGHSMLLVGYDRAKDYLIFKNSWGADSGHGGYVYLSYDYVQVYGKYGYAVMDVRGPGL